MKVNNINSYRGYGGNVNKLKQDEASDASKANKFDVILINKVHEITKEVKNSIQLTNICKKTAADTVKILESNNSIIDNIKSSVTDGSYEVNSVELANIMFA